MFVTLCERTRPIGLYIISVNEIINDRESMAQPTTTQKALAETNLRSSDSGAIPRRLREHALRVEGNIFQRAHAMHAAGSL